MTVLSQKYQCKNYYCPQQQCFSGLLSQKIQRQKRLHFVCFKVVVCWPRGTKHTWNHWTKIRQGSQDIGSELQSAKVTTN